MPNPGVADGVQNKSTSVDSPICSSHIIVSTFLADLYRGKKVQRIRGPGCRCDRMWGGGVALSLAMTANMRIPGKVFELFYWPTNLKEKTLTKARLIREPVMTCNDAIDLWASLSR